MANEVLLLSIKPQFAEAILRNEKKVELRRLKPRVNKGDLVIVYASGDVRAIVGSFTVSEILVGTPGSVWREVQHCSGVTKRDYDAYFAGSEKAVGIAVEQTTRLKRPLALAEVRRKRPGFHPPQSFHYWSKCEVRALARNLLDVWRSRG